MAWYSTLFLFFHFADSVKAEENILRVRSKRIQLIKVYEFQEYSDDSGSEPDVDLENQYYNAKALKAEKEFDSALKTFKQVLELESEKGEWGFKALKQMVKITFAAVSLSFSVHFSLFCFG